MLESSSKGNQALLLLLPFLLLANFFVYRFLLSPQSLQVTVLPVTEGDALLVRGHGVAVLIDAGGDASVLRALGTTLPPWQRHIDALVLTSPTAASAGGAPDVLARYRVNELIRPAAEGSRTLETALAGALGNTRVVYTHAGERFSIAPDLYIDVLWPPTTPSVMDSENGSLALRLTCGSRSFFFSENLSERLGKEAALLANPADLRLSSSSPAHTFLCP